MTNRMSYKNLNSSSRTRVPLLVRISIFYTSWYWIAADYSFFTIMSTTTFIQLQFPYNYLFLLEIKNQNYWLEIVKRKYLKKIVVFGYHKWYTSQRFYNSHSAPQSAYAHEKIVLKILKIEFYHCEKYDYWNVKKITEFLIFNVISLLTLLCKMFLFSLAFRNYLNYVCFEKANESYIVESVAIATNENNCRWAWND